MKILILSDGLPPEKQGGAEVIAWQQAKALALAGQSVTIITTTQKENNSQFENEGVKIYALKAGYHPRWRAYLSLYNPQTIKKVQNLLIEIKPDIVHCHNIHYLLSYYCLKLAKKSGAKVFLTAHDVMLFHYGKLTEFINPQELTCSTKFNYRVTFWQQIRKYKRRFNPLRNLIIKHYLKYVDQIFAVSATLQEVLRQNGIKKVTVLHNSIKPSDWLIKKETKENFIVKYNLTNSKIILFGGRLSVEKGSYQAFLTLERVIKEIPNTKLLILGQVNTYTKKLLDFAESRGFDHSVVFTGWLMGEELKAAYHCANVVLVPSICFDSFPTVVLEAMACSKPVIASCFSGATEILLDGLTGYIVNPFNTELMADRILKILSLPEQAMEFGTAGYQRVKNSFALDQKIAKLVEIYKANIVMTKASRKNQKGQDYP